MSPHHWLKALYVNNSPAHYSKVKTTLLNRWESFQLQTPKIKKNKSKPSYCPRTYQVRYCDLNKGWQQFRLDPNWTIECYRGLISTNYLTISQWWIQNIAQKPRSAYPRTLKLGAGPKKVPKTRWTTWKRQLSQIRKQIYSSCIMSLLNMRYNSPYTHLSTVRKQKHIIHTFLISCANYFDVLS